ncbi:MAG: hypothetical protein R6U00_07135, partial [Prochlorococcaceae cyanobacterium]
MNHAFFNNYLVNAVVPNLGAVRRLTARRLTSVLLGALLAGVLLSLHPAPALAAAGEAPVAPAELARAVDQMEQLDRMRISLASTLE